MGTQSGPPPDTVHDPGYSDAGGAAAYLGYFDDGDVTNPNTSFNPNFGTFQGGHNFDAGGGGPTNPNPAAGQPNEDYGNWLWEQILNEVLGLQAPWEMPDRSEISNYRWTGLEFDSKGDGGHFYIYGVTHGKHGADTLVYLNDDLVAQGAPWNTFQYSPYAAMYDPDTGKINYYSTHLTIDPNTFIGPQQALLDAELFFLNAAVLLNGFSNDLMSDESQFQGQAGAAFAQLIWDLWHQADVVANQMANSQSGFSDDLDNAQQAATAFLISVWNAYANWTAQMQYSPLGAILYVLTNSNPPVVVGEPGYWNTNPSMDPTNTPFGDLSTDAGWRNVDKHAQAVWLKLLVEALDLPAQAALMKLVNAYQQTQNELINVVAPPNPQITPPQPNYGSGGINLPPIEMPSINVPGINIPPMPPIKMPSINFPSYASMNPNVPSGSQMNIPSQYSAMVNPSVGGGGLLSPNTGGMLSLADDQALPSVFNALSALSNLDNSGFNGALNGLAGLGQGLSGLGGGVLNGLTGLGSLDNSGFNGALNGLSGLGQGLQSLGAVPPASQLNSGLLASVPAGSSSLNTPGLPQAALGATPAPAQIQSALGSSGQTQAAINQALASGQVPPGSALATDLNNAEQNNGQVQSLLGSNPTATSLQQALADNAATQEDLQKALMLAPASGPLHNALEQALTSTGQTQSALNGALATVTPPSAPLQHALTSDGALQSALNKALLTGQIPATGPLHSAVQQAVAQNAKINNALDQALAGGSTPSYASIQQAATANQALQRDLRAALASGQVPAHGPLHADLEKALADSTKLGTALHQALADQGIVAEPGAGAVTGDLGLTGGLGSLAAGPVVQAPGGGLATVGAAAGGLTPAGAGAATTLAGATTPVSTGAFAGPATTATGAAESEATGIPMFPPMMGGMGMGGMGMGAGGMAQERERTTWLSEDADVWGTEPDITPSVLGRDLGPDDDFDDYEPYDDTDRDGQQGRRQPYRQRGQ
jgi:hypothetical protein